MRNKMEVDLAVIGAGPAGITAGIYAVRYGLNVVVVGNQPGGLAMHAHEIENYPGFKAISGAELMQKFMQHATKLGVNIKHATVVQARKLLTETEQFEIVLDSGETIIARALILALGTEKKKLNIEGEDKFIGKGVSYCYTCDAAFFSGKTVAVIGGGDSAVLAALLLSEIAKKVYVVYRRNKLKAQHALIQKLKAKQNVEVIFNAIPVKFIGDDTLKAILLDAFDKSKAVVSKLNVDGCFIEIGEIPNTALAKQLGVNTDEHGFIIVDKEKRTNVNGIFAAGDCTNTVLRQIITACADGAIAAYSAFKYLSKSNENQ